MKKKNVFKILIVFVLSVCVLSSFAINASAASSTLKLDEWYRFVDSPQLDTGLAITGIEFELDGNIYNAIYFDESSNEEHVYISDIYVEYLEDDVSVYSLEIYRNGYWVNDNYRFIKFFSFGDEGIESYKFVLLSSMLVPVSDSPYGGLYGNVYSLIQDKIYGGYPLTGGAEIACSTVSTFLTIFVLVLPLALVWLIIKGLTALIGRVY